MHVAITLFLSAKQQQTVLHCIIGQSLSEEQNWTYSMRLMTEFMCLFVACSVLNFLHTIFAQTHFLFAGRHATNGKVTRLQGVVRQVLQGFGFIEIKDQDANPDKRFFYHTSEVVDQVELGVGDTVSFILTKGPKMREDLARKVVRTAVAPSVPLKVEEDPVRVIQKPASNLAPPVRIPAMPDGTKGFHMGRGRGAQPAAATATLPAQTQGIDTSGCIPWPFPAS